VVTEEQKQATIGSFYFIKKKVSEALTSTAKTDARALMDTIIDIVDRGITATPSLIIPATGDNDKALASATLVNNAAFIKAEIRAYLDKNYPEVNWRVAITKSKGIELRWNCPDPALTTFYHLKWA
jgi:hypothetical protein